MRVRVYELNNNNNNNNNVIINCNWFVTRYSGYFICIQNMKLVTNKFKSGGLREKHAVFLIFVWYFRYSP